MNRYGNDFRYGRDYGARGGWREQQWGAGYDRGYRGGAGGYHAGGHGDDRGWRRVYRPTEPASRGYDRDWRGRAGGPYDAGPSRAQRGYDRGYGSDYGARGMPPVWEGRGLRGGYVDRPYPSLRMEPPGLSGWQNIRSGYIDNI